MSRAKNTPFQNHPETLNTPRLYFFIVFIALTLSTGLSSSFKVGLIVDNDGSTTLASHFSKTVADFNNRNSHSSIEIQDVILKWDVKRPPQHNFNNVQSRIVQANISIVLSFLQSYNNDIFCALMAASNIIVINLRSESQTSNVSTENDYQNPSFNLLFFVLQATSYFLLIV